MFVLVMNPPSSVRVVVTNGGGLDAFPIPRAILLVPRRPSFLRFMLRGLRLPSWHISYGIARIVRECAPSARRNELLGMLRSCLVSR